MPAEFDAYDSHLTEWGNEETALFRSLGGFFIAFSFLERAARNLTMALCEVSSAERDVLAEKLDRKSLGGLAIRLEKELGRTTISSGDIVTDLKRMAHERHVLAHDIVDAVNDVSERPGFIVRGDEPKSVDAIQNLIYGCIELAERLRALADEVDGSGPSPSLHP